MRELEAEKAKIQKGIDEILSKFDGNEEAVKDYRNDSKKLHNLKQKLAEKQAEIDAEYKPEGMADVEAPLAPNGEKSNLSMDNWLTVRTKAFKEWFGDWENDPENASKVVDENGEPLVVYHGTPEDFGDVFEDKSYEGRDLDDRNYARGAFWFADKKFTAQGYQVGVFTKHMGAPKRKVEPALHGSVIAEKENTTWKFIKRTGYGANMKDTEVGAEQAFYKNGKLRKGVRAELRLKDGEKLPSGYRGLNGLLVQYNEIDAINERGEVPKSHDEALAWHNRLNEVDSIDVPENSRLYEVFLNIKNPLIVDMSGKKFDNMGKLARDAQEKEHDGLIVKDVRDPGAYPEHIENGMSIAVFDAKQIKSVDNRGTFDGDNPVIHFSVDGARERALKELRADAEETAEKLRKAARENGGKVYIRWGENIKKDSEPGFRSMNWAEMRREAGMSVMAITPDMSTTDIILTLKDYMFTRMYGKRKPVIYAGDEVGIGADGEPLISNQKMLGYVDLRKMERFYNGRELVEVMEDIDRSRNFLAENADLAKKSRDEVGNDEYGRWLGVNIVKESLEKKMQAVDEYIAEKQRRHFSDSEVRTMRKNYGVAHFSVAGMRARTAGANMEASYVDPADGKRKFVIPVAGARLSTGFTPGQLNAPLGGHKDVSLGALLHYPELYQAYPWLADMRVRLYNPTEKQGMREDTPERVGGYFRPAVGDEAAYIAIHTRNAQAREGGILTTLLHESQHAIQEYEGHAQGAGFFTQESAIAYLNKAIEQQEKMGVGDSWTQDNLRFMKGLREYVREGHEDGPVRVYLFSRGEQEARYTGEQRDGEPMAGDGSGLSEGAWPSYATVGVRGEAKELGGVTFGGLSRMGIEIAAKASDDTFAALVNGVFSVEDIHTACVIAESPEGQALTLKERQGKNGKKASWEYVTALVRGAEQMSGGGAMLDLFGWDTGFKEKAEKMARYVEEVRNQLKQRIQVLASAGGLQRRADVAKREGVKAERPSDAVDRIARLAQLDAAYERLDAGLGVADAADAWDGKSKIDVDQLIADAELASAGASFSLVRVSHADVVRSAKQMQQIIAKRQGEVLTNGTLRARVSDKTKRKTYNAQISERNLAAFGYDKETARIIHYTAASRIAELFESAEGEPVFIENYKEEDNSERSGAYHLFNAISIDGYGDFDVNINVLGYEDANTQNTLYQIELTIENPAHQEAAPGMPNATTPFTRGGVSGSRLSAYRSFVENEMTEIKKKSLADGTFMKAPNGADTKLTEWQWKMVRTKAFKEWFGDWENDPGNASKVVDENGEPLVVYHGTMDEPFSVFDGSKSMKAGESRHTGTAFWFVKQESTAKMYAGWGGAGRVLPVFLRAMNPKVIDAKGKRWDDVKWAGNKGTQNIAEWAKKKGYDAVIFRNIYDHSDFYHKNDLSDVVAVFDSTQIKSVENRGTFDAENPDITLSLRGRESVLDRVNLREMAEEEAVVRLMNRARRGVNRWRRVFEGDESGAADAARALGEVGSVMEAVLRYLPAGERPSYERDMRVVEAYARLVETGRVRKLNREAKGDGARLRQEVLNEVMGEMEKIPGLKGEALREVREKYVRDVAERRMGDVVVGMVEAGVRAMERHLVRREVGRLEVLAERLKPKKKANGKLARGKMSAGAYREFTRLLGLVNMTAEAKAARLEELQGAMAAEKDAEKAEEMGRELAEVATFGALRDAGLVNARRGVGLLVEYARSERAAWAEVQELERGRMRRVAGEALKGLGGVDELKVAETKAKGSRLAGLGETIVTGFQSLGQMFYSLEGVPGLGDFAKWSLDTLSRGNVQLALREQKWAETEREFMARELGLDSERKRNNFIADMKKLRDSGVAKAGGRIDSHLGHF